MPVTCSAGMFHIRNNGTSLVMTVENGLLLQLYYGKRLKDAELKYLLSAYPARASFDTPMAYLPLAAPTTGIGSYCQPSVSAVRRKTGDNCVDLRYRSHRVYEGKPELSPLPSARGESRTLEITLEDSVTGLLAVLSYSIFKDSDVISVSRRYENSGSEDLFLTNAQSVSVPFPDGKYDLVHFPGAWARERSVARREMRLGEQTVIKSSRGASSHSNNPSALIAESGAGENNGNVYGISLLYSGDFLCCAETDNYGFPRLSIGMNPETFSWALPAGESFTAPEAALLFSSEGFNGFSHEIHSYVLNHIIRASWQKRERPILINNWEATYFDFNEEKILKIAREAREMGIEMFVLDDGWFGKRDSDNCSLGDWKADKRKLPNGLEHLVSEVTALGLKFGLWFEPEMVSPDSDLYREHPDWCLHAEDRPRTEARNQLILDLSRDEVAEYVYKSVASVLRYCDISYVKWDMNRNMTEGFSAALPPERQPETHHRYILNLYRVFTRLNDEFPSVLFEGCSGGGGRFDLGMLAFMPQIWTSDDTDPIERLKIQYGTSYIFPPSAMGAHVSASPNHQTGRRTSIKSRGEVALAGNFGFELDVSKLTEEDKEEAKRLISLVKRRRALISGGVFTRLSSPFESNFTAWQFADRQEKPQTVILCAYRTLAEPNGRVYVLHARGLDDKTDYRDLATGSVYSGGALMYAGIPLPKLSGDFDSMVIELEVIKGK